MDTSMDTSSICRLPLKETLLHLILGVTTWSMILEPQDRMRLRLPVPFKEKAELIYAKLAEFPCCILFPNKNSKKWHNKMLL